MGPRGPLGHNRARAQLGELALWCAGGTFRVSSDAAACSGVSGLACESALCGLRGTAV